jgi:hypothetical protein
MYCTLLLSTFCLFSKFSCLVISTHINLIWFMERSDAHNIVTCGLKAGTVESDWRLIS